jgi:2-polyprenyl-3-methyl-5-hydroxy-6-metoxy-1,4-benzoquinol methylase
MMQNSLERIVPNLVARNEVTGDQTLQLHLERYHYAGSHLVPGAVADVACGVGYGSHLLATKYAQGISNIKAVDIDAESIAYARAHYQHTLIDFINSDALSFVAGEPLHNIVSLETIEHLPDPQRFINHMASQLVSGGRFVASVPITPSMDANPYHLQDFSVKRFTRMFTKTGFRVLNSYIQVQPFAPFSVIGRKEQRSEQLRKNIMGYYLTHPDKFFLRVKSILLDGFTNKYMVAVFEKL